MARARQQPALPVGPFDVAPEQVVGLDGARFASWVTQLLALEVARAGMDSASLDSTYLVNRGDEGVDAGLRNAESTLWIPAGDSAWQFKAGDLAPAKCKEELAGKSATYAREIIQAGGSYRLVLGGSLTPVEIKNRRKALIEAARDLGLTTDESRFEVVTADGLARWLSEFPAIAVDRALGGLGPIGQTFSEWSDSPEHAADFVQSDDRDELLADVRGRLASEDRVIRVDGVSGVGKTRLVLEALRGNALAPLVLYVSSPDELPPGVVSHMQRQNRSAVLVIDDCDRRDHQRLAAAVHAASTLRLITIGEPDAFESTNGFLDLKRLPDDQLAKVLRGFAPQLSHEQERVVVEVAAGNIAWARKLADAVLEHPVPSAGQLIRPHDLLTYVSKELPEGSQLPAAAALALFRRVGFDGDLSVELDQISAGLEVTVVDLRAAASFMSDRGMVTTQGRFRSVGPHPLALFLAAKGWEIFRDKIASELIPSLSAGLIDRLFRRAIEIGGSPEIEAVAASLLDSEGLATLATVGADNNGNLLGHLAVLVPDLVVDRLSKLVDGATDDQLASEGGSRRSLVTALQKLAWHRRTFEEAADRLLRLGVVEIENYGKNASATWTELFGTMLPGTAATPSERLEYLEATMDSGDRRIRMLVVKALDHAMDGHEFILSAGELQGGRLLERRGAPVTWGEVWEYRNKVIDFLAVLASDADAEVRDAAIKALSDAVHGVLEVEAVRVHLATVLSALDEEQLGPIRAQISSLEALFKRVPDAEARATALAELLAALPSIDAPDELRVLARTASWDRDPGEVRQAMHESLGGLDVAEARNRLFALLATGEEVPAAFETGQVLSDLTDVNDPVPAELASLVAQPSERALFGFLNARVEAGRVDAFDAFVAEAEISDLAKIAFSLIGPKTEAAAEVVDRLVPTLSVFQGARVLLGRLRESAPERLAGLLRDWLARMETQNDYNAVVDLAAMYLHGDTGSSDELDDVLEAVISRRREFPELGNERWDWSFIASQVLRRRPMEVLQIAIDLMSVNALNAYEGSDEDKLLQLAVELGGANAWKRLLDWFESGGPSVIFYSMSWLGNAVDLDVVRAWVGDDVKRARVLSSSTSLGSVPLSPTATFLLEKFPNDGQVGSALASHLFFGFWSGNESDRIKEQIAQISGWIEQPRQAVAVKKWARGLRKQRERALEDVLRREAERDWY